MKKKDVTALILMLVGILVIPWLLGGFFAYLDWVMKVLK